MVVQYIVKVYYIVRFIFSSLRHFLYFSKIKFDDYLIPANVKIN